MEDLLIANKRSNLISGLIVATISCVWTFLTQTFLTTLQLAIAQFLTMVWVVLHLPLHMLLWVINPPMYLDDLCLYFGVFLQWLLIGWIASKIYRAFQQRRN